MIIWTGIVPLILHYSRCLISGSHQEAVENCVLLRYYRARSGNLLQTFRDNLSVPSAGFKNPLELNWRTTINTVEELCLAQFLSRNKTDLSVVSYSWWIRNRTWCSQGTTAGVVSDLWQNTRKATIWTVIHDGYKACTVQMYVRCGEKIQVPCIDGGDGDDKIMLCGRIPLRGRKI